VTNRIYLAAFLCNFTDFVISGCGVCESTCTRHSADNTEDSKTGHTTKDSSSSRNTRGFCIAALLIAILLILTPRPSDRAFFVSDGDEEAFTTGLDQKRKKLKSCHVQNEDAGALQMEAYHLKNGIDFICCHLFR